MPTAAATEIDPVPAHVRAAPSGTEHPWVAFRAESFCQAARDESLPISERVTACWSLLEIGEPEAAVGFLEAMPGGLEQERLIGIARRLSYGQSRARMPRGSDVMVAPQPGARKILAVFAGFGFRFVVQPFLFERPDCHVVLVRDPWRTAYVSRLKGLGASYAACSAALGRLFSALGSSQTHMVGLSLGGYGALRFGLDLAADTVTGFSAPTSADFRDEPGATIETFPEIRRAPSAAPDQAVDAVPLYLAAARRPPVRLYYGALNERDTRWAMRMAHVPGVTAVPVPCADTHHSFNALCDTGEIRGILGGILC